MMGSVRSRSSTRAKGTQCPGDVCTTEYKRQLRPGKEVGLALTNRVRKGPKNESVAEKVCSPFSLCDDCFAGHRRKCYTATASVFSGGNATIVAGISA